MRVVKYLDKNKTTRFCSVDGIIFLFSIRKPVFHYIKHRELNSEKTFLFLNGFFCPQQSEKKEDETTYFPRWDISWNMNLIIEQFRILSHIRLRVSYYSSDTTESWILNEIGFFGYAVLSCVLLGWDNGYRNRFGQCGVKLNNMFDIFILKRNF